MEDLARRTPRRQRRREQGFTLIELLVVIAILSVLAAVVIFNVVGVKSSGQDAACQTDTSSTQTAVDDYENDNPGSAAVDSAGSVNFSVLQPKYLNATPTSCTSFSLTGDPTSGYVVTGKAPDGKTFPS